MKSETADLIEELPLREVLDNLRIVAEPAWREIEGNVRWNVPEEMPVVLAEPHGLLQAFLDLAQNSHRAVQEEDVRDGDAIRKVAAGEPYLEENYLPSLLRSVDRSRPPSVPKLTDRDRSLLRFVYQSRDRHGAENFRKGR